MKNKKREFDTGATRNASDGKFVYKDFINPLNEYSFAKYMHGKRKMSDGSIRDGDNWQKGIPQDSLLDSLRRHVWELEMLHLGFTLIQYIDSTGEHTEVIKDGEEKFMKALIDGFITEGVSYNVVDIEDVLNAIRFNSEGYKLQELGYKKNG